MRQLLHTFFSMLSRLFLACLIGVGAALAPTAAMIRWTLPT